MGKTQGVTSGAGMRENPQTHASSSLFHRLLKALRSFKCLSPELSPELSPKLPATIDTLRLLSKNKRGIYTGDLREMIKEVILTTLAAREKINVGISHSGKDYIERINNSNHFILEKGDQKFFIYQLFPENNLDFWAIIDLHHPDPGSMGLDGLYPNQDGTTGYYPHSSIMGRLVPNVFLQFLEQNKDAVAKELCSEEMPEALTKNRIDNMIELMNKISKREDDWELNADTLKINEETLQNIYLRKSLSKDESGHAIAMHIKRLDEDNFEVTILNTGDGLEYHHKTENERGTQFYKAQTQQLTLTELRELLKKTEGGANREQSILTLKTFYTRWNSFSREGLFDFFKKKHADGPSEIGGAAIDATSAPWIMRNITHHSLGPAQTGSNCASIAILELLVVTLTGHKDNQTTAILKLFNNWHLEMQKNAGT